MIPETGVVDYSVAFLLNTLLYNIPITPVATERTNARLKPIALYNKL
jgi:hypothetical protein